MVKDLRKAIWSTSHHGSAAMHLLSSIGTAFFHCITRRRRDMYIALAFSIISCWARTGYCLAHRRERWMDLALVSRQTEIFCDFLMLIGLSSRWSGMPWLMYRQHWDIYEGKGSCLLFLIAHSPGYEKPLDLPLHEYQPFPVFRKFIIRSYRSCLFVFMISHSAIITCMCTTRGSSTRPLSSRDLPHVQFSVPFRSSGGEVLT